MSLQLFDEKSSRIFTIGQICQIDEAEMQHNNLPHLHDFYSIFWIESGEAVHATDFVEYSLVEGTVLFVPPGLKHRMYIDRSVTGSYMLFNEEFIAQSGKSNAPMKEYRLFNNPEFKSLITVPPAKVEKLRNIVGEINAELSGRDVYSEDIVINLLHQFLLESRRIFDQQNPPDLVVPEDAPDSTIIRFKQLIEENYTVQKNVSAYAQMLQVNASCLNELSKRITGITAGELIRNRVIDECKRLLYSSSLSGKEIAYQLGFEDPAYFSRFFRKYTGLTLKEYRQISRKKYH